MAQEIADLKLNLFFHINKTSYVKLKNDWPPQFWRIELKKTRSMLGSMAKSPEYILLGPSLQLYRHGSLCFF